MTAKQNSRKRNAVRPAEPTTAPSAGRDDEHNDNRPGDDEACRKAGPVSRAFGEIASRGSQAAGRASTFIVALALIVVWGVTGPLFGFSDTWQLIINTSTTIVTFLMVFLIQNSQNRDSAAIQVKLDELIRVGAARNSLVGIEHLTDEELEELRTKCEQRAKVGQQHVARVHEKARHAADRIQG